MDTPELFLDKLKTALNLVEELKKENERYKNNSDQLSLSFSNLQEKHERVAKEYSTVVKEKDSLAKDIMELKENYKQKLLLKEKQIEDIRTNPPTQKEQELLKLEITQDVEKSQKAKFELIEKECTKFRNLYYKIKREWDSSKTEYDMKTMELERSKDELQRQYELEISNLSNKITILQNNAEDTSELQRLRVIQREKNDLELKVRSLLQELDDIRAAKEELRIQSEKDERLFKRQLADQISVGKSFQSEKDSLQSKCNVLEDEMRVIQRQKEDLVQELNRLRKELDKVVNRLEENAHQYTVSISDLKINYLKDKNEASIQIEELNNKINHLQVDLKLHQDTITEQKEKISSQERDYLDKIRLAREEEWSKISILEQEKHELEKQISVWKHTHSESESKNEGLQKEFVQELDRLKKELQEVKVEKEQLSIDCKNLVSEKEHQYILIDKTRKKAEESQSRLEEATSTNENLKRKIAQLNETMVQLEAKVRDAEQQISHLNDQAQRENEAFEHTIERLHLKQTQEKQKYAQEMELLQREKLQYMEKIEYAQDVLDKQQQVFETKINLLKEKVKICKSEAYQSRSLLEQNTLRDKEKHKRQADFLQYLNSIAI